MSNEVQLHERSTAPTAYEPRDIGELRQFAQEVTATQLVPEKYRGKPADAMVAMMYGKETANLGPLASLQYVAVINGRPAFYGDALPGIAFNKGLVVDMEETLEGEPMSPGWTAVCVVTRSNGTKVTQRFSVADAKRAGLWDKAGPWKQYPQRMMQWRARSWAIRDAAPHMLFGPTYEELRDIENYVGPDNAREINPPGPKAAERRAAMAAVEWVEIVDEDGGIHSVLPGEVKQFLRDHPEARRAGEEPHQAWPTEPVTTTIDQPAPDDRPPESSLAAPAPRNGNNADARQVTIALLGGKKMTGPLGEMRPLLEAAFQALTTEDGYFELRDANAALIQRSPKVREWADAAGDRLGVPFDDSADLNDGQTDLGLER